MNYDECISWLQTLAAIPQNNTDIDFQRIVPAMFLHAEGRIYRELQFLQTLPSQTATLTANNRDLTMPSSVLNLMNINVCTPSGAITTSSTRHPLERIPPEVLDYFWPKPSLCPTVPTKYAVLGSASPISGGPQTLGLIVRFMPTPDKAYNVELLGRILPTTLSPDNPETFLSLRYPELFLACCMTYLAGYQRDYGSQADDPSRAMSWETQYTNLRQGVMLESAQLRGEGPGWSAATPAPAAQARAP